MKISKFFEHIQNLNIEQMCIKRFTQFTKWRSYRSRHHFDTSIVILLLALSTGTAIGRPCVDVTRPHLCNYEAPLSEDKFPDHPEQSRQKFGIGIDSQGTTNTQKDTSIDVEEQKKSTNDDERDVVDREDHVTQYLSEMLVNTDSEITGLQASDIEEVKDENSGPTMNKEDRFFAFLTGQEDVMEVDSAISKPARSIIEESELS